MTAPTYKGDPDHPISATGNACVGDAVAFERATYTGSYPDGRFAGYELVTGVVVADAYGPDKQQHTFTILRPDGTKLKIKGRNLYRNGLWRAPWADEGDRVKALLEKYQRGNEARARRDDRKGVPRAYRYGY